jgi:glycolate oxidase FAD binding subunit
MNRDTMLSGYAVGDLVPQKIYSPRDAQELAQILAECNSNNTALVPWGGGTLQHLANSPARYNAVLCTTGLNQVIEYAADDLTATFGAGMTLTEIDRVLSENGQFLPLDVPHPDRSTIGGVLAAGVNGGLRLRYGPARDYMIGNRFATVDGSIIKAGSKVVKNVAGYELHKVQVGAFGTLGILTEAVFKLFPIPSAELATWSSFENAGEACATVAKIWSLNTPPVAIELLDAQAMRLIEPQAQGHWFLVARFGGSKATMAAARDLTGQVAEEHHSANTETVTDLKKFWRALANLPSTLHEQSPESLVCRISAPPKEFERALRITLDAAGEFKQPPPRIFAHAAVASMYASLDGDTAFLENIVPILRARLAEIHSHLVVEYAPTSLMPKIAVWEEMGRSLKMMRSLKLKFDPNNILNPGRFVAGI